MADCEELVAAVQRGDREKLPELWDRVRAFAARQGRPMPEWRHTGQRRRIVR